MPGRATRGRDLMPAPQTAHRLRAAAVALVENFDPADQAVLVSGFTGRSRYHWNYRPNFDGDVGTAPVRHPGIAIKRMSSTQRQQVMALLGVALSEQGVATATAIMERETDLRELEKSLGRGIYTMRDPESYFCHFFGDPRSDETWAWRFGGHHLSLNFTVVANDYLAVSPMFMGAYPETVTAGPAKAAVPMFGAAEALVRKTLEALTQSQLREAQISEQAPSDLLTDNFRTVYPFSFLAGSPLAT